MNFNIKQKAAMNKTLTLEFTKATLLELLQGCSSYHFNSILWIECTKKNEVMAYIEGSRQEMISCVEKSNFSTFDVIFDFEF